jgi:hypothetical protein
MQKKRVGFYALRCMYCKVNTISAYDSNTLHEIADKLRWAWIGGNAICRPCIKELEFHTKQLLYKEAREQNEGVIFDSDTGD